MISRCYGNFRRFSRIHLWWSHFCIKETEILPIERIYHWHFLFGKFLKIFEKVLTAPSEQLGTVAFDVFQFFIITISATLNVNKKILHVALLELTPYRISMPVSFLENLTQIIFSDSLKQNQQLACTVD